MFSVFGLLLPRRRPGWSPWFIAVVTIWKMTRFLCSSLFLCLSSSAFSNKQNKYFKEEQERNLKENLFWKHWTSPNQTRSFRLNKAISVIPTFRWSFQDCLDYKEGSLQHPAARSILYLPCMLTWLTCWLFCSVRHSFAQPEGWEAWRQGTYQRSHGVASAPGFYSFSCCREGLALGRRCCGNSVNGNGSSPAKSPWILCLEAQLDIE